MIADCVNSAGDIFSSLMTYIGNKIASKPKDDSHNLGHGKAEYIFSLLIGISMIIIAAELFMSSIDSLLNGGEYNFSVILIIVCAITILIKFSLYVYTHKLSKKHNNLLIEANAKDHRNDCLVTTFTLISALQSGPNATTLATPGSFLVSVVKIIPLDVLFSTSSFFKITLSCNGLIMLITPFIFSTCHILVLKLL